MVRRSRHDLENAESELHVVEGLLLALHEIDEVIRIIRKSRDRASAAERLQDRFGLSEAQADAILKMRLGQLTALEREELETRRSRLEEVIADLRRILASEREQLALVLEELEELTERFGDRRRTVILEKAPKDEAPVEDVIADEDAVITVSHQGFVKRIPIHLYRRRVRSGKALAGMENYEDDWLERVFTARTKGWLLAFTERGKAHFLSVLDVPESSRASRGQSIYALLNAERGDRIVALVAVEELEEKGKVLLFVSRRGIVKRTGLGEFSNPRAGGIIAVGVKDEDEIMEVVLSDARSQVMLLTRKGRAIRFEEKDVSIMGRSAQGVKGIDLGGDDRVIGVILVRRDADVLTMSEEGWAKRTPLSDFPLQKRGGKGTMAVPSGRATGSLVGALEVVGQDEVTVVTASGGVTHLEVESLPEQGRRTRGTRVVRVPTGDRVVEVSRSIGSEEKVNGSAGSRANGGSRGNGDRADSETGSPATQPDLFVEG